MVGSAILSAAALLHVVSAFNASLATSSPDNDWIDAAIEIIGDRRIVALGEATHGDGTSFLRKAELMERLYERGFDVLAFEGSLYPLSGERVLETGEAAQILSESLFPVWARAEQFERVYALIDRAEAEGRPLTLIGFDFQLSPRHRELVVNRLEKVAAKLGEDGASVGRIAVALETLMDNYQTAADLIDFTALDNDRRTALAAIHRNAGPEVVGDLRWVDSIARFVRFASLLPRVMASQNDPGGELNVRDEVMATNFTAQALAQFPDRKIMLWGASSHFLKDRKAIEVPADSEMISMGMHLAQGPLADEFAVIGFTALGGNVGTLRGQVFPIPVANPGSVEAMAMANTDDAVAFAAMPPCGSAQTITRTLGHTELRGDWGCALDGLVVIREMEATHYPGQQQ